MGDTQLDQTSVEKDLGIHVDHQLKFREQAAAAISKASRILALIRRSFALLDESTLPQLFERWCGLTLNTPTPSGDPSIGRTIGA